MIPAEAVEAAAKMSQALYFSEPWESLSDFLRSERLREAELVLEAAAPYLCGNAKAEAWEEGYEQADSDAPHSIKSENPYRDQDATGAKIFASLPDGSVVGDMVKDGGNWYYIGSGRMVPPSKIQDAK